MSSGRKLPQTPSILKSQNAALKNKVKSLSEALEQSYSDITKLHEIIKNLKKEKAEVEEILQYREEFIAEHC